MINQFRPASKVNIAPEGGTPEAGNTAVHMINQFGQGPVLRPGNSEFLDKVDHFGKTW
jgi:hypothetical protein